MRRGALKLLAGLLFLLPPAQALAAFEAAPYETPYYGALDSCSIDVSSSAVPGSGSLLGVTMPNTDTSALADAIDKWIAKTQPNSPLKGLGNAFVSSGSKYDVNPALAVAQANQENSLGTVGANMAQKNALNIRTQSPFDGIGQNTSPFKSYSSLEENIKDFNYILNKYYIKEGFNTVDKIINKYAPPSDGNDTSAYIANVKKWMGQITQDLKSGVSAADNPAPSGPTASDTLDGHKLPATKGGVGSEGATSGFALGQPKNADELKYFINMRWTYAKWDWKGHPSSIDDAAYNWMKDKHPRVLVTDQSSRKSVIVAALDAGPAPWTGTGISASNPPDYWQAPQLGTPDGYKGRVAGLSTQAFQDIGAQETANGQGDDLVYAWAPDQSANLGPTNSTAGQPSDNGNTCASDAGGTGDGSNAAIVASAEHELQLHLVGTGDKQNSGPVCKYNNPSVCGEAWCADFVSWVFHDAGRPYQQSQYSAGPSWRISFAASTTAYFKDRKDKPNIAYGTPSGGDPIKPGYAVHFVGDGGHTGIVEKVNGDGSFDTIEGNVAPSVIRVHHTLHDGGSAQVIDWGGYKS